MNGAPFIDPETGEVLEAGGAVPPSASAPAPAPVSKAMSLDDARALLVRVHGVAVSTDDPMLMMVTLHQGMLADYEAMLNGHDTAIQGFLGATGEACVKAVEAVLASLKDKTVKASLDHAFALVAQQEMAMEGLRRELRRHRLVHSVLTLVTALSAVLVTAILFSLLR